MMQHAPAFSSTAFQALVEPATAAPQADYRLLTLVDIVGMEAMNRTRGWQHGDDAIRTVGSLLSAATPDGAVWRPWRGGKFLASLAGSVDNEAWLSDLPGSLEQVVGVSVTVCALKLYAPTTDDVAILAEFMERTKRHERGMAYVHDARRR